MKCNIIAFATLIFTSLLANAQDTRQMMLLDKSVHEGLQEYLAKIPVGHEDYFGFSSRLEFEDAVFGRPFQIYYLKEDSLDSESLSVKESKTWLVPVQVDENYKCFLRIRVEEHEFKVVGIGYSEVASDVQSFERNNSATDKSNNALLIDEEKNVLFMVDNDDRYSSIRGMLNPATKEFEHYNDFSRQALEICLTNTN